MVFSLNLFEDMWNSAKAQLCSQVDLDSTILIGTCSVTVNNARSLSVPYALICKIQMIVVIVESRED